MRSALACAALLTWAAAATQPPNVTVPAADEQLIYSPRDAWTPYSDPEDSWITRYSTRTKGASVAFTFNGSYVAYYTQTSSDHGPCDIMLDGQLTARSAKSPDARSHVLLFAQAVDPSVEHTVTITNAHDERTSVDYFIYSPVNSVELSSRAEINAPLDSQPKRQDDPAPFGLVIGGAVGGAALLLSIITLALVVAPPDPPQLSFMRTPGAHVRARRRPTPPGHGYAHLPQQHHPNSSLSLPRGESSRLTGSSRAHLHTHSGDHSHAHSHHSRSPSGTARHHGSHSHAAPYPNPFASTSRVDVGPSRPSSSASSSHIPLQQQGRLPLGQGFICASCSVELARERTARQRQQQQESARALWYDAGGSYQQLQPARFPHQQQPSSSSHHHHHQHAGGSSHQASSSSRHAGSSLRPPRR